MSKVKSRRRNGYSLLEIIRKCHILKAKFFQIAIYLAFKRFRLCKERYIFNFDYFAQWLSSQSFVDLSIIRSNLHRNRCLMIFSKIECNLIPDCKQFFDVYLMLIDFVMTFCNYFSRSYLNDFVKKVQKFIVKHNVFRNGIERKWYA